MSIKKAKKRTTKAEPAQQGLRNRVVERRQILGSELVANERNWRKHPKAQAEALRGILTEIGMAGELLAYYSERAGGKLVLVDGHLRSAEFAAELWDVAITDLTDAEADKLLLVHDPVAAMAQADKTQLDGLMRDVQTGNEGLAALIGSLAKDNGLANGAEDQKPPSYRCPQCNHEWSGKRKP